MGMRVPTRRRAVAATFAAGVAAVLPAGAHAGPRFDYRQVYTTPVPGASAGIDTKILYKHPDDPKAKPIPVRKEVFTFPRGSKFDESVVPDCTVPDLVLQLQGKEACPDETWIGGGHNNTNMTGFQGTEETPITVDAFEHGGGRFRVVGGPEEYPVRLVAHGRRVGRVTTVEVPPSPGGPPDGQSALRRIRNIFPPRSLGDRAYVRTPPKCPKSGVWTFKARLTFADGGVETNLHRMRCQRKRRR
jgi:hypothetical protein